MICSYILTALVAFIIGGFSEFISSEKRRKNYKKKLILALDYYKINNQDTTNVLILDLED